MMIDKVGDVAVRRSWSENAHEYRLLTKQGVNVRLAVLVACSVNRPAVSPKPGKITVTEFARHAGTTPERAMRHLTAWDACARDGLCLPSTSLTPNDAGKVALRVPDEAEFVRRFDASKSGGRPRAPRAEVMDRIGSDREWAESAAAVIAGSFPDLLPTVPVAAVCDHPQPSGGGSRGPNGGLSRAERRNDPDRAIGLLRDKITETVRVVSRYGTVEQEHRLVGVLSAGLSAVRMKEVA